ncbi:hypothetical protein BpHYR1_051957 [Brachionus plicatilis]|uniref:Uncharacterized protein n=1 Tax=Brachionus plicatilis TaxID=10195 RepID=A0A3M7SG24_BRAPC|nr:hypothetical protein BpHYR1_051957 [Brachionus plicatilis]
MHVAFYEIKKNFNNHKVGHGFVKTFSFAIRCRKSSLRNFERLCTTHFSLNTFSKLEKIFFAQPRFVNEHDASVN